MEQSLGGFWRESAAQETDFSTRAKMVNIGSVYIQVKMVDIGLV